MRGNKAQRGIRNDWCSALAILLILSSGCGTDQGNDTDRRGQSEPGIEAQIANGRAGQSDRIELFESIAGDEMLLNLGEDDAWVETLILDQGVITDVAAEAISRLPNLSHLRLRNSPISDDGLRHIAGCESLLILNLPQCQATADGIAALAEIPELSNLRLGGTRLDGDTAAQIANLKSLRNLHLIGVPVDDVGLRQIASLPKLRSLYLDDSAVTSQGWDWLFDTHPQLHVHVNQKHLDRGHHTRDSRHDAEPITDTAGTQEDQ